MKRYILSIMAMIVLISAVLIPIDIDHTIADQSSQPKPAENYTVKQPIQSERPTAESFETVEDNRIIPEKTGAAPNLPSETPQAENPSATPAKAPQISAPAVSQTQSPAPAPSFSNPIATNTVKPSPVTPVPSLPRPTSKPTSAASPTTVKPNTEAPAASYAEQVVRLVNQERAKEGLAPLSISQPAQAAAQVRVQETETSFSHTRPNGSSFSTALTEQGVKYRTAGENIAYGQRTPEQVMEGWMNSPGHRANIMNSKFTAIGVGYYRSAAGVNYWSQMFIG